MSEFTSDNCDLFSPDSADNTYKDNPAGSGNDSNDIQKLLISPTEEHYDLLVDHFKLSLEDGHGETLYQIGQSDGTGGLVENDFNAAVATLKTIADQLNTDLTALQEKKVDNLHIGEYLIRQRTTEEDFTEVRVAVVGNVDAGKSTLLGVLTHGSLDDGRGTARLKLFRHKHEQQSGRTSSVGNDILGFSSKGEIVNQPDPHSGDLDWCRICKDSAKVITFLDLAGHEKYLKTTVFGMTGHSPAFAMLMIGANMGVVGMTKEHLGLALALNVPVFVVVTKIDMCPDNVRQNTLKLLARILKSPGCRKIPVMVSNEDDVLLSATNFTSERICPIFQVSNVTGTNLDLLKMFLNLLSAHDSYDKTVPPVFQIDDTYSVPGVGTVVSGTTLQGVIHQNDVLLLGPNPLGAFITMPVKSIHRKRLPVKEVRAGQTASFSLKKVRRDDIRKGMVLVSKALNPKACWEFEADVLVLHHPTTISVKYQAMVHCGSLRQTASIIGMDKDLMRTGDRSTSRFRLTKCPEYLTVGTKMIFREGRTKAVGTISKVYTDIVADHHSHPTTHRKNQKAQLHYRDHNGRKSRSSHSSRNKNNDETAVEGLENATVPTEKTVTNNTKTASSVMANGLTQ